MHCKNVLAWNVRIEDGSLTTSPNENMSDAFVTPIPVCPSGLHHMAFPIAYGVWRDFSPSRLKAISKSPRATLVTVLQSSWSQVQSTRILSGFTSVKLKLFVNDHKFRIISRLRISYWCGSSLCHEDLVSPLPRLVRLSFVQFLADLDPPWSNQVECLWKKERSEYLPLGCSRYAFEVPGSLWTLVRGVEIIRRLV